MKTKSRITLTCSEDMLPFINGSDYHTMFSYDKGFVEDLEVCDPINIRVMYDDGCDEHVGIAEITSIKKVLIGNIDKLDFERQTPGWGSMKETIERFAERYPEYRSDFHRNTPVTVVTYRKLDYDLKVLNKMINLSLKTKSLGDVEQKTELKKPRKVPIGFKIIGR